MKPTEFALFRCEPKLGTTINGRPMYQCLGIYPTRAAANAAKKEFANDGIKSFVRKYDDCDELTKMLEPIR